ncbi:hypothetical protein BEWA_014900 [Theileria equi strain WA]|uniref:Uncharacterized protein n=1 Tax=Theileria equi strain WA TaxID=1537102 RepID=L1LC62_THEEQ|nr:hypothetical protein BEWA_014900 [Theileria equi strain WA]EKX72931.1 hypothetical protein BEWA_014900 [Theileria equi strain WA]|eukprot:XP_004832383.1 hypothetical protein BEWA_014900 [Theileria equi strain WA]
MNIAKKLLGCLRNNTKRITVKDIVGNVYRKDDSLEYPFNVSCIELCYQNSTHSCHNRQKRFVSHSNSGGNGTATSKVETNACVSGEIFDKDTFVKLLRLTSTNSSDLFSAINKSKDELRKLSAESHPFSKHDLHILMQLLSEVLAIKTNKKDVDLFHSVLESFRNDSKFPSGLGLCTMFSSTNDSKAKLPSRTFSRTLANKIGIMGAKFLAPKSMTMIDEVKYDTISFKEILMDKFVLTIGGKRDDVFKGPHIFKEAMAHQIVLPHPHLHSEPGNPPDREQYKKTVFKTFEKGIVLRMEIVLLVKQSLSLLDSDDNIVWKDVNPDSYHRLYFESELKPEEGLNAANSMKFTNTDWVLVDINSVLCGNNPF